MARNRSATRSARGLFGLGALAEGIQKGLDQKDALAMKIAERAIEQQKQIQSDKEQADTFRLKALQAMQGQEFVDPSDPTGKKRITIPGVPQATVEQQFPNLLLSPPKQSLPVVPGVDVGAKGRPMGYPPTDKANAVTPGSQLDTLNYLEGLLTKIPTNMTTGATAAASKMLGGQRDIGGVSVGSNPIKEYEDAKPGAAVQFYRALTGDTRLSDADAQQRALPFLPQVYPVPDTDAVRIGKMTRIKKAFQLSAQQRAHNPDVPLDFTAVMNKAASGDNSLQPGPSTPSPSSERIRVRRKDTGKTGSIPKARFDPAIYEVIQ